jgi:hypothetical protein
MVPLEAAAEMGHADLAAELEQAVEGQLTVPPTSGDRAQVQAILQQAQLYGLSRLAAAAEAQLARLP